LAQIVRTRKSFRSAEASGKLVRVATGDGMALFFRAVNRQWQVALHDLRQSSAIPNFDVRARLATEEARFCTIAP